VFLTDAGILTWFTVSFFCKRGLDVAGVVVDFDLEDMGGRMADDLGTGREEDGRGMGDSLASGRARVAGGGMGDCLMFG